MTTLPSSIRRASNCSLSETSVSLTKSFSPTCKRSLSMLFLLFVSSWCLAFGISSNDEMDPILGEVLSWRIRSRISERDLLGFIGSDALYWHKYKCWWKKKTLNYKCKLFTNTHRKDCRNELIASKAKSNQEEKPAVGKGIILVTA